MNGFPFSQEENEYLRQNWSRVPNEEIYARLAPHSKLSIARKAYYLGCKRRRTTKVSPIKIVADLWKMREKRGFHRKTLARVAGYHEGMIQRWEKGEAIPSLRKLIDWCDALGCDLVVVERANEPTADDRRPDYNYKIHRICMGCRTNFQTSSRFIRRCDRCREQTDGI